MLWQRADASGGPPRSQIHQTQLETSLDSSQVALVCVRGPSKALAAALTAQLLANGPEALREAKALCADLVYAPLDDRLLDDTSRRIAERRVAAEGQEGLQAFLEKRAPAWANAAQTATGAES